MRRHPTLAIPVLLGLLVGGCSEDAPAVDGPSSSIAPLALSGPLTVFAASSLTEAFTDTRSALAAAAPHLSLSLAFAGSQALVRQLTDGAPADVVALADQRSMDQLVGAGLVAAPRVFARNTLQIAVAPGNPKHVTGLPDLARSGLIVVLADPSVPVGAYAQQVLDKVGVEVRPASLELDVKAALAKVTSGEADAAIVYATDVRAAGAKVTGVTIPATDNLLAEYSLAVVKASGHQALAAAFMAQILTGAGQRALRARGLLPPA
jgi:molybdate transport system substrate-binding protein